MKLLTKAKYFLFLSLVLFSACDEEIDSEALVFTEDVIFVSGEIMRVTGRVVASGEVPVTDHGFQIDESETFDSPIVISLGERNIPGRFIGTYEELSTGTDYFVRSFMVVEGETRTGAAIPFSTLNSELSSYNPQVESVGGSITIFGRSLTKGAQVFFGEVPAQIIDFKFESVLRVRIPSPRPGEYVVPIRVISDGTELVFDDNFEYVIGKWENISTFPGPNGFSRNAFFSNDGKLYAGITIPEGTSDQVFWTFDIPTQQWTQTTFAGQFVENPGLFDGGFLAGESSFFAGVYGVSREFWVLNNSNEFESIGTVPFNLHRPTTFREGDDLYVFGGWTTTGDFSPLVWRYNFTSRTWVEHDLTPTNIFSHLPSFSHNGLFYFIDANRALFRYDPVAKNWEEINQYPGDKVSLAMGVTVGDYAYIGLASQQRGLFEYDINNNSWIEKTAVPGLNSEVMLGYYSYQNRIYVLRSQSLGIQPPILYSFDPFDL